MVAGILFGLLACTVTFVVLPALATPVGQTIKPPSVKGILPTDVPTGGQSNDCAVFYPNGSGPLYQYRISNPKTQTYTTTVGPAPGTTVTFTLTMNPSTATGLPAYTNDKYVSVTSTGAAIVDIGIKGGTDTARYNYSGIVQPNPVFGFVTDDGNLHAPAQSVNSSGNPTSLYSVSNLTFCFNLGSTVSGSVFNDANNNGSRDSGEGGQQSWTVNLYNGSTAAGSMTSAAGGSYQFTNVTVGATYTVCIVGQTGWRQTLPTSSTTGSAACSGTNPAESPRGYTFTMDSPKAGLDFGNVQLQSISGIAFNDANGNGVKDGAESGQSGLTMTLYNGASSTTATTVANGAYQFANQVVGGSYSVCISTPTPGSWVETLPASGGQCTGAGHAGQSANGYSFTLASTGKTADFGHQQLGSVSGTIYQDVNQDGTENTGDTVLGGWTVNLYKGSTLIDHTTSSAADGSYVFTLPFVAGSAYKLCEAPPAPGTWAQSEPLPATPDICGPGSELIKGQQFTPVTATDTVTAKNFGNVPAVLQPCVPPMPFGVTDPGGSSYLIQLAACKPGQTFVFSLTAAAIDGDPNNTPGTVSVWVGDETLTPKVPLVEKIVFPFTIQPSSSEPLLVMHYDDTFPFSVVGAPTMPFCNLDPRDPSAIANPDFAILPAYATHAGAAAVLPIGATSCLIVQTESSTRLASGVGTYTAYVYSELDGLRAVTP